VKCVSFLFDGLPKGATRSITEGEKKVLGKLIYVSLSATKKAANKRIIAQPTEVNLLVWKTQCSA